MHVLTKIFIVLVSLLAVLLVPLVVVYAYNENSFKSQLQASELNAASLRMAKDAAEADAGAMSARLIRETEQMRKEISQLQNDKSALDATNRQLESQLATSKVAQSAIVGDIATIKTIVASGQQLTESLVSELRDLRVRIVKAEQDKVQLDESLRDVTSQLEVAEQARRALAEELARLKDEHNKTVTALSKAVAMGFNPNKEVRAGALGGGIIPDKTLTAKVIRVERSSGQVLAEIDAGSRDGVKENWSMTIADRGDFVANLRIINVDINHSTGVVSLEQKPVQVNQSAHAFAGQN